MSANGNLGATSLSRRKRREDPMREYDRLPPELRAWLSTAALPWAPRSVLRTYRKFLERSHDRTSAIEELRSLERRIVAKDARKVWGEEYPCALELAE